MVLQNQNHQPAGWSSVAVRRVMPSLLQGLHSRTETHVHGEIVRRRIAGRAVGEITGQSHQRNESHVGAIHSPAVV